MKIDQKDLEILQVLSLDSRSSLREIAKRVHLSAPAVGERIRQMESFGVIKGYTAKVDYTKIGLPIQCLIEATVRVGQYEAFRKIVRQHPHISSCSRIAGQACYILKLHAESLPAVEEFIDRINPYVSTTTHIIFSELETKVRLIEE